MASQTPHVLARLHATVNGHVQGVGFRYFVMDTARRLGVNGWTRNRANRTVEVMAEAPKDLLEAFLQALNQGPNASKVSSVEAEWLEATGEFDRFRIRMTR
ncbi:MAG: acylphosphatase [Anaerolineae bacterium]|nr:acylphosphatase [Anaerolineae bacterium]